MGPGAPARRGNDIHAPALIRTDRLRQLGGFATDPRLDGFEDYDLWCRMAERGWRGQLVPQVLARRTESGRHGTVHAASFARRCDHRVDERAPSLMSGASALLAVVGQDEVAAVGSVVGVVVAVVGVGLGPALA